MIWRIPKDSGLGAVFQASQGAHANRCNSAQLFPNSRTNKKILTKLVQISYNNTVNSQKYAIFTE